MTAATLTADLVALPELDDRAVAVDAAPRIDEWPARLQGIAVAGRGAPVVVTPPDAAAVAAVVRWAGERGPRVQALGAGSNVVGAVDAAADILISTARLDTIERIDETDLTVTVGAGVDGRRLEDHLQDRGFTLGHYPQSLRVSTVGGWIATRATGTYSAFYGGIEHLLVGADYVDAAGTVVHVAPRPRPSGGLDLLTLLCGSEGSLGIVTKATLAIARPLAEQRVCAGFPDLADGIEAQRELVQHGVPLGLVRLYNAAETRAVSRPGSVADGQCLLVVTTIGPDLVASAARRVVENVLARRGGDVVSPRAADPWFERRYAGPGFMAEHNADPRRIFDTVEVALPWSSAAACAAALEDALSGLSDPFHQHFSHVYRTGVCLYAILSIEADDAPARWREAWSLALDIVDRHGGTLAHHHGIGAQRAARYQASAAGRVHKTIAAACDPAGVLAAPLLDTDGALLTTGDGRG